MVIGGWSLVIGAWCVGRGVELTGRIAVWPLQNGLTSYSIESLIDRLIDGCDRLGNFTTV